jgi:hypothetical protein
MPAINTELEDNLLWRHPSRQLFHFSVGCNLQ